MNRDRDPAAALDDRLRRQQRTIDLMTARVHLLEEECQAYREQLQQHGISIPAQARTNLELPAPVTAPVAADGYACLTEPEHRLLQTLLADDDTVYLLERSETLVDVGHWLSRGVLWLAATATDLVLFAAGRRPLAARLDYHLLQHSLYNHVTGELVLASVQETPVRQVRLSAMAGYQLLAQIYAAPTLADPPPTKPDPRPAKTKPC